MNLPLSQKIINNNQTSIQHRMTLTLCILFAALFGIWLQPETIFLRNIFMISGAIISLPILFENRQVFLNKKIFPGVLIVLLILWVTYHLFFLGVDFEVQKREYVHAWKRIAISFVFALGLGLSLNRVVASSSSEGLSSKYWNIIYLGFCMPAVIYCFKLAITLLANHYGLQVSPYLIKNDNFLNDNFGIPRPGWIFFTIPALAISLNRICYHLREKEVSWRKNLPYVLISLVTIFIYLIEKDRIGQIFLIGIVLIESFKVIKNLMTVKNRKQLIFFLAIVLFLVFSVIYNLKQNPNSSTFFSDAKIAIQVDHYDNWKYTPEYLPKNDQGETASDSNYKRISWIIVASRLIVSNPLGYGLMSFSFGRICKTIWPDSETSWSHSAWLDFTLGYGWIGALLFLGAAILVFINSRETSKPWNTIGLSVIGTWTALFCVKELSAEVYVNAFIFMIIFAVALTPDLTRKQLKD